jgi:hypothetical protein
MPINDNPSLEKEADEMGAKAAQGKMANVAGKGSGVQRKGDSKLLAKAKETIDEMQEFTSRLYTTYILRLGIVERLLSLENTDLTNVLFTRLMSEAFEGIGAIGGVWEVVAEAIKVGWDTYGLMSTNQGKNKVSYEVHDIAVNLEGMFSETFNYLERQEVLIATDDSLASYYANHPFTPAHHAKSMEISNEYETGIWKQMLPIKWKHIYGEKDHYDHLPDFSLFYEKNPNHWKEIVKASNGYDVTEHWMASGATIFSSEADHKIGKRLFNELNVDKRDLYLNWGLPMRRFIMPKNYGPY